MLIAWQDCWTLGSNANMIFAFDDCVRDIPVAGPSDARTEGSRDYNPFACN